MFFMRFARGEGAGGRWQGGREDGRGWEARVAAPAERETHVCRPQACTPYSSDGAKGIAKTLKTAYVIAPPPPPPPRRMFLVRNNVVVSVGKPGAARTNMNRLGFTLLTYNVLAEIYVRRPRSGANRKSHARRSHRATLPAGHSGTVSLLCALGAAVEFPAPQPSARARQLPCRCDVLTGGAGGPLREFSGA